MAQNGLEARTPFLDKQFVRTYLSIPYDIRYHPGQNREEKYLIREAFKGYIPDEIITRQKEAFSDGVSGKRRSWYEIIQERVTTNDSDRSYTHIIPQTPEQKYYRNIFDKAYPTCEKVIPYYWMPKYVEATDASARTLQIYGNNK